MDELIQKSAIWRIAAIGSGAAAAIITGSRDDALHTQQIAEVQVQQQALAVEMKSLDSNVASLNLNLAVLTRELKDDGSIKPGQN